MSEAIVIVSAMRTPLGRMQGELASFAAHELGGRAIQAALTKAKIVPEMVDELLLGCVLPAGQGQAPARQAGFHGGLGQKVPAVTLNKMCGSGMKAVMMAYDQLKAGNGAVIVAGGMESMSNAPHLLLQMRGGVRLGHSEVKDHMFLDGLEDAYDKDRLMGTFAEDCAEKYQFSREAQDEYALASFDRALRATERGVFANEIVEIDVKKRTETKIVSIDESLNPVRLDKISQLKPVFRDGGTVTAANASSISDGAAVLVLMRESEARAKNLNIRARLLGHTSHAQEPAWFSTAPVPAMQKLMKKLGLSLSDVDLWEVNEAFAVVPMAAMEEIGMDHSVLNVYGGACALGHPIGASGARIIVTLLNALEQKDKTLGIASLCIGGGEGTAVVLERVN